MVYRNWLEPWFVGYFSSITFSINGGTVVKRLRFLFAIWRYSRFAVPGSQLLTRDLWNRAYCRVLRREASFLLYCRLCIIKVLWGNERKDQYQNWRGTYTHCLVYRKLSKTGRNAALTKVSNLYSEQICELYFHSQVRRASSESFLQPLRAMVANFKRETVSSF